MYAVGELLSMKIAMRDLHRYDVWDLSTNPTEMLPDRTQQIQSTIIDEANRLGYDVIGDPYITDDSLHDDYVKVTVPVQSRRNRDKQYYRSLDQLVSVLREYEDIDPAEKADIDELRDDFDKLESTVVGFYNELNPSVVDNTKAVADLQLNLFDIKQKMVSPIAFNIAYMLAFAMALIGWFV